MRFVFLIIVLFCFACNRPDEAFLKDYDNASSYYFTDLDKCERLTLGYFNQAFKAKDEISLANYSYLLGVINTRRGKYVKAADNFGMSSHYFIKNGEKIKAAKSIIELSYINNQLKNHKISKEDLKEVLAWNVIDEHQIIKQYVYLFDAYFGLNENDSALNVIEELKLKNVSDKNALSYKYSNLGYLFLSVKKYDEAINYLNKTIQMGDNNYLPYSYNNLAYIYMERDNLTKAMEIVNKAIEHEESYSKSQALRTRAFIYIKRKEFQLATNDLLASEKYYPNYGVIADGYEKIAIKYESIGDKDQIVKYWKLHSGALKEKSRLESEQNIEANEVRESIYRSRNNQLLSELKDKDKENIYTLIASGIVVILIFYIYHIKTKEGERKKLGANKLLNDAVLMLEKQANTK